LNILIGFDMIESGLYLKRGVSSGKEEVHNAIRNLDKGLYPNAFCKILPDMIENDPESCVLMHADGAGTKSSLAYLYWKETGDISVFKGIAVDSLIMNLDDMACVGATDKFIFSNTIGRNKLNIPGEVIQAIIEGYQETIETLSKYDIDIINAGGETADVGDLVRTVIVDSSLFARMKRKDVIDASRIRPGDVIIGLSSSGQCEWETEYNSGIGSNGLTAAKHDLLYYEYEEKYPESFSPEIPNHLAYCGERRLEEPLSGTSLNIGKALLSPTRTYTPLLKKIYNSFRGGIHGVIHCSGGGQTKCVKFGNNIHYVKDRLFDIPPLFRFIQESTKQSLRDLFPILNMGHRMEIYCSEEYLLDIVSMSKEYGIGARQVGYCAESSIEGNELTIKHENETMYFS